MEQNASNNANGKDADISRCRVRRIREGAEICLVNAHCIYELPFSNLCTHPMASQIAEEAGFSRRE